jgi:uncharacterized protein involved in exopolysaccharide biosynthesis
LESDPAAPESQAFRQLEQLVRHLGEELATFRKRAQAAEARARTLEVAVGQGSDEATLARLTRLEAENADLRARLGHAAQRTRQLAARVKFIRQQNGRAIGSPGGSTSGGNG